MLTVPEAAHILRVSANHIYRLCADGELAHRRLGKRVLIPKVVVDDLCGLTSAVAVSSPAPAGLDEGTASGDASPRDDSGSLGKCAATVGRSDLGRLASPTTRRRAAVGAAALQDHAG